MPIIHRYILRTVLESFLFCAVIILSLTVLLDFVEQFQDFSYLISRSEYTWWFAANYYVLRLPLYLAWLLPVVLLAGTGITIVYMTRENEFVPFFMAGHSIYYLLVPVFVVGLLNAAAVFSLQEWVLPGWSDRIAKTKQLLESGSSLNNIFTGTGENTFLQFKKLRVVQGTARGITLSVFQEDNLKVIATADRATWNADRNQWILRNGTITEYDSRGFRKKPPRSFGDDGLMLPELRSRDLRPKKLLIAESGIRFHSLKNLYNLTYQFPELKNIQVRFHTRIIYPLIALFLPVVAIPLILRREITSYFTGSIYCAVIAVGFYLVYALFLEFGKRDAMPAFLACWLPILLLASVLLYLYDDVTT